MDCRRQWWAEVAAIVHAMCTGGGLATRRPTSTRDLMAFGRHVG
jgi:hypothetical protein